MQSIFRIIRKNTLFRIFLVSIPILMILIPAVSSAATSVTAPNIWGNPPGFWGPILSCTGNYLPNGAPEAMPACTDLNDLAQTFVNAIYLGMSLALFIIAPMLFLVGAIMMMFAGAKPDMVTKARQTMIGAVIGVVIVLCSYLIVGIIISIFHISGITGFPTNTKLPTAP